MVHYSLELFITHFSEDLCIDHLQLALAQLSILVLVKVNESVFELLPLFLSGELAVDIQNDCLLHLLVSFELLQIM